MDKYDRVALKGVEAITPILEKVACDGQVRTVAGSTMEQDLQNHGVDLLLWDTKDNLLTIEVKASGPDNTNNKTVFIETITDIVHPRLGWLHKLQVDLLAHVNIAYGMARLLRWAKFKRWFDQNIEEYRKSAIIQIDSRKSAVGYWVPWKDIALGIGRPNFGTYDLRDPDMWQGKLRDMGLIEV